MSCPAPCSCPALPRALPCALPHALPCALPYALPYALPCALPCCTVLCCAMPFLAVLCCTNRRSKWRCAVLRGEVALHSDSHTAKVRDSTYRLLDPAATLPLNWLDSVICNLTMLPPRMSCFWPRCWHLCNTKGSHFLKLWKGVTLRGIHQGVATSALEGGHTGSSTGRGSHFVEHWKGVTLCNVHQGGAASALKGGHSW